MVKQSKLKFEQPLEFKAEMHRDLEVGDVVVLNSQCQFVNNVLKVRSGCIYLTVISYTKPSRQNEGSRHGMIEAVYFTDDQVLKTILLPVNCFTRIDRFEVRDESSCIPF